MSHVGGHTEFLQAVDSPTAWRAAVLLLVCLQLHRPSPVHAAVTSSRGSYRAGGCICAADIFSCTTLTLRHVPGEMPVSTVTLDLSHNHITQLEDGAFQGLLQLETLRLAHNQLTAIMPGAFRNSSGAQLRNMDLSSNHLCVLEEHYFQELSGLEELLLFNNRISRVEGRPLAGLTNLRKAYLSHNRLTDFPFFSIQKHSHPHLSLLDLSSNRLSKLPLEDILALPHSLQKGLYLHNNSLWCECPMYSLFRSWEQQEFESLLFFRQEHVCLVYGNPRGTVRFLQHGRYLEKCNLSAVTQKRSVTVTAGKALLLHCATTLSGHAITFLWVSPSLESVLPPGNNGSLKMFSNGSLEIMAAREKDTGIYWCLAEDRQHHRNDTWEVNVTVLADSNDPQEPFNTGFTTLLGCVVSLVLVLMYLYLTPCRCPPCLKAPPLATATPSLGNEAGAGSAQSSILTPTPPASTEGPGRKVSTNKHVVFLEPIREQQNGRLRAGPGHLGPGLLLGAEQQPQHRAGETDSIMSVFSDTPIMMP